MLAFTSLTVLCGAVEQFEKLIRSEDLERIFSPYGTVTEVYIKDSHMDRVSVEQCD